MKATRLVSLLILGVALVAAPVYAQRGGGGSRGGGGGSHSSGGSVSRGGGGYSGGSRSGGSSYSGSRSSSSSRSTASYSGSRSSSSHVSTPSSSRTEPSYSRSSSPSTSRPSSAGYSRSERTSRPSASRSAGVGETSRSGRSSAYNGRSRTGSVPDQVRSRSAQGASRGDGAVRGTGRVGGRTGDTPPAGSVSGRPSGTPAQPHAPQPGYATPGHPGPMPPSHRHMHPAPYFWHPYHHCMVHCHQLYWDPFVPRPLFWPGFWVYCDSYWYDYHVSDIVVVREYAHENYGIDLVCYAMSGNYMYALVNDPDGHTYIQIYDKEDKLLAEQQVSRKYCKMEVDPENGGCWIMKKNDKDPLLFFYTEDGQLLIYEADK